MPNRRQAKAAKLTQAASAKSQANPVIGTLAPKHKVMDVSYDAVLKMRGHGAKTDNGKLKTEWFRPYEPAKGVLPAHKSAKAIASDAAFDFNTVGDFGAVSNINSAFQEGYAFPGFTVLANWAQITEFRKPAEVFAREMTREWIKFTAVGEEDKTDRIKELEDEFQRLNVRATIRKAIEQDGFFGRSQIFLDVGINSDSINPEELKTELVESPTKIGKGALKRLTVVEAIWSYPNRYNASDPLDETFYKPYSWFVMGKEIHSSRLLTIVTRQIPDILKPAYAFAGLSLSQMLKPYVDNWLRTRQSVSDLIHSFTVWTLSTDMSTILNAGAAESLFNRLQIFNLGRDNHGVNAINKETETFENVSAPLGSLDKLQAQSQEQMSAAASMPLVYMTGITPSGLNATSDGEIRVFQDTLSANQELYTPIISKIMNVAMLSLWGEIDKSIRFKWEPLYSMSEAELATARKTEAETDVILIDGGVLSPEESRKRIASQENTPYQGLDINDLPTPPIDPANDPDMMDDDGNPPQPKANEGVAA